MTFKIDSRIVRSGVKPLPGLATMAVNAVKAAGRAVKGFVATGKLFRTPEEALRIENEICATCPEFRPDKRCAKCGCHLGIKAAWLWEKCPLGKW